MLERSGAEAVRVAQKIAALIKSRSRASFGQGKRDGSINASVVRQGVKLDYLSLWSYGKVVLCFGSFTKPPFDDEHIRQGWLDRLKAIPGIQLPSDAISRWRTVPLLQLTDDARLKAFLATFDWLADTLNTI
jgi:hypothetical protein